MGRALQLSLNITVTVRGVTFGQVVHYVQHSVPLANKVQVVQPKGKLYKWYSQRASCTSGTAKGQVRAKKTRDISKMRNHFHLKIPVRNTPEIKNRHEFDCAMAAPRRGTRAEFGMIHNLDFTVPFQKAL